MVINDWKSFLYEFFTTFCPNNNKFLNNLHLGNGITANIREKMH